MIFTKHPNTSLFLWVASEQSNSQPNLVFIAYYLIKVLQETETDDPNTLPLEADPNELEPQDDPNESQPAGDPDVLTLEQTWKSCLGYYLFLKSKPDDLNAFAAEASLYLGAQSPAHTGFLWLAYDGRSLSTIASIETITGETDSSNPRIVLPHEVLLDFGGYKLPFGKDTPVVYETPKDPSGFVFLVPPNLRIVAHAMRRCRLHPMAFT